MCKQGHEGSGRRRHSTAEAQLRFEAKSIRNRNQFAKQIERLRILMTEAGILATQRADSCQPPLLSCSEGIGICAAGGAGTSRGGLRYDGSNSN